MLAIYILVIVNSIQSFESFSPILFLMKIFLNQNLPWFNEILHLDLYYLLLTFIEPGGGVKLTPQCSFLDITQKGISPSLLKFFYFSLIILPQLYAK